MMTCAPASRAARFLGLGLVALVGASCADSPAGIEPVIDWSAARKASATIEVASPTAGSTLSGLVELRASLSDATPAAEYNMFWQVDGGTLTEMGDDGVSKVASADVSRWDWHGSGPYTVTFVARQKRGNKQIAQQSVEVYVSHTAPPPTEPAGGTGAQLFASRSLWVNPYSNARKQADEWRNSRPADATEMDKVAGQPDAQWFGDWNSDIQASVAQMTKLIVDAGRLPVYVAYNIPLRDCSSYSAGGAASASAYRSWIRAFASGLGTTSAVVILEPDALAMMSCLTTTQQDERYALLADAVNVLKAQGSAVYIDAGHSRWIAVADMAARLDRANIAQADGFTLNISNFQTTASNLEYGVAVSSQLSVSGRQFIVDTSRNGLGPTEDNQWCNPDGRSLGAAPTIYTGHELAVAYLWIKKPGESDGTCNGGPSAGSWWAEYALGLAQRTPVIVAYGG